MSAITLTLIAILALGAGFLLLELLIRRSAAAAVLILATGILTTAVDVPPVVFGPFNVFVPDIIFTMVGAAGIARLVRDPKPLRFRVPLIGLAVLLLVSLVRGAMTYEVTTAVVEFRESYYFLFGALYFSTTDPQPAVIDRILRWWVYAAVGYCAVVFAFWVGVASGLAEGSGLLTNIYEGGFRVVHANETLVMAQAFLILLLVWDEQPLALPRLHGLAILLVSTALLLQHRTVWVVLMLAAIMLAYRRRALRRKLLLILAGGAIVASVAALTLFGGEEDGPDLTASLEYSATDTHTFEWRLAGWATLLREIDNPVDMLIGLPFGTGYERVVGGFFADSKPHNYFIEVALRQGILGLLALVALYWVLIRRLRRQTEEYRGQLFSSDLWLILLFTHLIYWIPYAPYMVQGIITGLAIAYVRKTSDRTIEEPEQVTSWEVKVPE